MYFLSLILIFCPVQRKILQSDKLTEKEDAHNPYLLNDDHIVEPLALTTPIEPIAPIPHINQAPVAVLQVNHLRGEAPLELYFDASQSVDLDGDALSYQLDFGNGEICTAAFCSYTFEQAGIFDISLTAFDSRGQQHTTHTYIIVNEPISSIPNPQIDPYFDQTLALPLHSMPANTMNKLSQEYDNSIFDSVPSEFLLVGELFDHTLSNESSSVIQSLAAQSEMETKGLTNEIRLFPNPVDGIVNLHLSSEKKANYQLWILDLSGKTV